MSFDYTGSFSGSFTGEITATNGVVSSSKQVNYTQVKNKPTTISAFQKNSIVANNNFREVTYPIDSASFNARFNGLSTDVSNASARIDALSAGSGSADWATITNKPDGLVSASSQITDVVTDSYISASAAASGFGTGGGGTSDFTQLTNVPSGLISSSTQITSSDLDMGGNKVLFGNVYSNLGDLPSASTYHGMFAHVHATGKAYFAHGGNWVELANASGNISSSTQVEAIIDNVYISASAAASGFGAGGGGETYTEGLGIDIVSEVISIDTSSTHFKIAVSQSAASYGFGSGGGGGSFGDPPTFDQDGLQVNEFIASGSTIGTLTVTDVTPGDTATFAIQDAYTDDLFKISESGVVTTNTLVTSSMNTTAGSGSNNSYPFLVKVTDGQNNVVEETIYIYVRPNSAPVFKQTSVNGTVITSFTSNAVNENSADGSTIATIYFTDANSDTITIRTGSVSPADHFDYTVNSNNVVITQDTASLDFETYTSYTLSLTASDEHYESGVDDNSLTTLEITIPVGDNAGAVVNNQTLDTINENSSNNTVVDSIVASDSEGDTITFSNFTLKSAYIDGVGTNVTSSLGGTSLYDPHTNPFNLNAANGQVTRKSGVFLNSDIANRYTYEVTVNDNFNSDNDTGSITIPISDDAASSIGVNGGTYYVHEGALTGKNLSTNSNGYASGDITFTSAVSQMWEVNSVPSGYVRFQQNSATSYTGSSVTLEVATAISGNLHFADSDTVAIQITASETSFETTKQYRDHTLTITDNQPYEIVFINTSDNLNTNGARPSNILSVISFDEPQFGIGDTIDHSQFSFTDPSGQLTASLNSDAYEVSALTNLSGSTTYEFTASIADSYGNISTSGSSFTIAQAPTGTLSENGTFYIIESATSGDNIRLGTNGRSGTLGDLGVSYSPQYNSAAVTSFTSSNALISVASNGNLSVGTDISGSGNTDGDTITSNITWQDGFGNIGGPTAITVNVTENFAPTAADTPNTSNLNTNLGVDDALLATLTWSDTEGDSLNISSFALSGDDASSLSSSYNGGNAFGIYANGDRSAETLSYTASVEDTHGFSVGTYKDDITIAQADDGTLSVATLYIIESATSGDGITTDTDGKGSATSVSVGYSPSYGSPLAQNFSSTSPFISIDSSTGELTVGTDISGSVNTSGDVISTTIGWEDQFGNTDSLSVDVNVTTNQAPSVGSDDTPNTSNWNTNLAVDDALLATLVWTDPEGDTLDIDSFNLGGNASLSSSYNGSNTFGIYANGDRSAGTISYTANIDDEHGFNTGTYSDNIIISQAGGGSLAVSSFNIIESALSGSNITTDTDGIGSAAQLSVNYSPDYGGQSEQNFATVSSLVHVTSTGILTIEDNVSGSYANGANFTAPITWVDQYGNAGAETITIEVRNNVNPSVTFASNETVNAPLTAGTKLGSFTISDTENDTPFSASISGRDASKVVLDSQNVNSSSYFINAADNSVTSQADLHYMVSVNDAYGEGFVNTPRTSSIGAVPVANGEWYAYLTEYSQYIGVYGDDLDLYGDGDILGNGNDDGVIDADSIFDSFASGEMGASVISDNFGGLSNKTFLIASGSILSASISTPLLDTVLHNTGSNSSTGLLIVFPSSSNIGLLPDSIGSSQGDNTSGRYVMWGDNSNSDGLRGFKVRYFDMEGSNTYTNTADTRFGVIFGGDSSQGGSGIDYYLLTASGSYSLPNNK